MTESCCAGISVLMVAAFFAACQSDPESADDSGETHAVVGAITHMTTRDDGYVDLTLEGCELEPPSPTQYKPDTVLVLVVDFNPLLKETANGSLRTAKTEDLTIGARIRAYYGGIMWRTDPPGFVASKVVILRSD